MKHSELFILPFLLILVIHYAQCQGEQMTYKFWYENIVMNCTAGSEINSYKPHMVCTCISPGYIGSCQFTGMREPGREASKLTSWTGKYNTIMKKASDQCKKNPTKDRWAIDKCNWCYCLGNFALCTKMICRHHDAKGLRNKNSCKKNPLAKFKHEDGCNWCYCMDRNTPICTRNLCPKKGHRHRQRQLENPENNVCRTKPNINGRFPHSDNCNWCWCVKKTPMCTVMTCIEPVRLSTSIMKPRAPSGFGKEAAETLSLKEMAQKCKRGHSFKEPNGCSTCICIEDGVVICPPQLCP